MGRGSSKVGGGGGAAVQQRPFENYSDQQLQQMYSQYMQAGNVTGANAITQELAARNAVTQTGSMTVNDISDNIHYAFRVQDTDRTAANSAVRSVMSNINAGDEIFAETTTRSGNYNSISITKRPDGRFDIVEVVKGRRIPPRLHAIDMATDDVLYFKTRTGGNSRIDLSVKRYKSQ